MTQVQFSFCLTKSSCRWLYFLLLVKAINSLGLGYSLGSHQSPCWDSIFFLTPINGSHYLPSTQNILSQNIPISYRYGTRKDGFLPDPFLKNDTLLSGCGVAIVAESAPGFFKLYSHLSPSGPENEMIKCKVLVQLQLKSVRICPLTTMRVRLGTKGHIFTWFKLS